LLALVSACGDHGLVHPDGGTPCGCPAGRFCVNQECIDECGAGRSPCAAGVGGEDTCCPAGQQCCAAADHGYDFDVCARADAPCPIGCDPDLDCGHATCTYDAPTDAYECTDECAEEQRCGESVCCPLGTECASRGCPLPDLAVDADFAAPTLTQETFSAEHCALVEGCVAAAGSRRLLRFNTRTPNLGPGDVHFGAPDQNALFEYSPCHGHYHFTGYADYELIDLSGNPAGAGHKQAFCLIDLDCPVGTVGTYRCDYQGITAGCADVYSQALDCQWIDVTDVVSGRYYLVIELNRQRRIPEVDYSNNRAEIPVVVCRPELGDCDDFSSCPGGCDAGDVSCCAAGDPCGKATDGICDCGSAQPWDHTDCAFCDCR
jgi:hypothetical protein